MRTAPLTPDLWPAFAALFESDGIPRGCWCMWWRESAKAQRERTPDGRRAAFRARVEAGPPPGVLALEGDRALGWAQVAPRAETPRFDAACTAKPVPGTDPARTWALTCFFVAREARGLGLMEALARAACAHAAGQGAAAVEAAPIEPHRPLIWGEGFVGLRAPLERAGFREVERRTPRRALMRWTPDGAEG
jgi:GNAT superfamily N-acetyltransferase